jgi:hypothetical protein
MSGHTAEPWVIDEFNAPSGFFKIRGEKEILILGLVHSFAEHGADPESTANVERIVACVNGCAGINPAVVPDLVAAVRYAASLPCINGDNTSCHTERYASSIPCSVCCCRSALRKAGIK